jgi:prepilin-type N-terminal cleavage/methylation domain-containing protein
MSRMIDRVRALHRGDGGFTVTELLLAMAIGLILTAAGAEILVMTMKRAREVDQRVDTTQRGRLLMDTMTRDLRSQICMTTDVPPIRSSGRGVVGGRYTESVDFYTDLTDGRTNANPELRSLIYDETARTVIEEVRVATSGTVPNLVYPTTATSSKVIATDVVRDAATPMFRFYAFTAPAAGVVATPTSELTSPLSAANIKTVAKVGITFRTVPLGGNTTTRITSVFTDDVYVRAADPNDPAPIPTCA